MRIKRVISLVGRAAHLIFTGQFDVLRAVVRRRLGRFFYQFLSIEHIEPDLDSGAAYAHLLSNHCPGEAVDLEDVEPLESFDEHAPLVSVVVPCFNYGTLVERAIDSVLNQTLQGVEIVVVEGGSTDAITRAIVTNLKRPRTRVILQDKATLVGENRNRGIAEARGRYVCCLDADDTIDPTYLEKAVYLLETHRYDLVSTGIRMCGVKSGTVDVLEMPNLRDMTEGNHVTTCAVFRRRLWDRVGGFFDTGKGANHVAEDWDLWLRIAAEGARIRNISREHLFNYTIHASGSLSSSSEVRSRSEQREAIVSRNRQLLVSEAFAESSRQARRRIALTVPGGALLGQFGAARQGSSILIALPYLIVGGAERLLASIVQHLVTKGWRVTVISTLPQDGHEESSEWFKKSTSEVYMLPRFLRAWEYDGFVQYILQSRHFDVVLLAGSRLIYDLLPDINQKYPDLAVVDLLFNTVGHTDSHSRHRGEITLAIGENPEVIEWLRANGWDQTGARLIESGVDVQKFSPARPPDLARKLGVSTDEIVVGFSGRLSSEKAPEVFVEIAAAFKDEQRVRFIMTGAGPLRATIASKIGNLPAGVRIDFLGLVDSTVDYFSLYDIFVLPSRLDGRPIALIEALASGCAVVASGIGGIPAVLEGTGAGILCRPADVASFVAAIRELIARPDRLNEMKRAAREAANRMVSESEMGAAYEDALIAAIEVRRGQNWTEDAAFLPDRGAGQT